MKRENGSWWLISAVIHVMVLTVLIMISGPSFLSDGFRVVSFLDLSAFDRPEPRIADLPALSGPDTVEQDVVAPAPRDTTPAPAPPGPVVQAPPGPPGPPAADEEPAAPRGGGLVVPSFQSGRLWERPLRVAARAYAGGGEGTGGGGGGGAGGALAAEYAAHVARVDSAVAVRIRAFLDTLPPDSFAVGPPPDWTTEIAGQTWGIDQQWIYLGGLKLPTALLALLPFPQGNYEQAQRAAELQRIREDIMNAAWRATSAAEFRENVRALRERMDRERELERNQSRPDSTKT